MRELAAATLVLLIGGAGLARASEAPAAPAGHGASEKAPAGPATKAAEPAAAAKPASVPPAKPVAAPGKEASVPPAKPMAAPGKEASVPPAKPLAPPAKAGATPARSATDGASALPPAYPMKRPSRGERPSRPRAAAQAEGAEHGGKDDGHAKAAPGGGGGEAAMLPSISTPALRDEMAHGGPGRDPGSDREKMEALSADLARARTALLAETARLENLLAKTKPGSGEPAKAGSEAGAPGGAMPIGDPMAPVRTTPPADPATQVDLVSKAMKGMKPEQAAAIIAHLDRSLAGDVLSRMRPADAGLILGFLKPELGAMLAAEIAGRPALPAKPKTGGMP